MKIIYYDKRQLNASQENEISDTLINLMKQKDIALNAYVFIYEMDKLNHSFRGRVISKQDEKVLFNFDGSKSKVVNNIFFEEE